MTSLIISIFNFILDTNIESKSAHSQKRVEKETFILGNNIKKWLNTLNIL